MRTIHETDERTTTQEVLNQTAPNSTRNNEMQRNATRSVNKDRAMNLTLSVAGPPSATERRMNERRLREAKQKRELEMSMAASTVKTPRVDASEVSLRLYTSRPKSRGCRPNDVKPPVIANSYEQKKLGIGRLERFQSSKVFVPELKPDRPKLTQKFTEEAVRADLERLAGNIDSGTQRNELDSHREAGGGPSYHHINNHLTREELRQALTEIDYLPFLKDASLGVEGKHAQVNDELAKAARLLDCFHAYLTCPYLSHTSKVKRDDLVALMDVLMKSTLSLAPLPDAELSNRVAQELLK